jgi:hypothetical protein
MIGFLREGGLIGVTASADKNWHAKDGDGEKAKKPAAP